MTKHCMEHCTVSTNYKYNVSLFEFQRKCIFTKCSNEILCISSKSPWMRFWIGFWLLEKEKPVFASLPWHKFCYAYLCKLKVCLGTTLNELGIIWNISHMDKNTIMIGFNNTNRPVQHLKTFGKPGLWPFPSSHSGLLIFSQFKYIYSTFRREAWNIFVQDYAQVLR